MRTKPLFLLILLCLTGFAYGQTITGGVVDKATREPIASATVTAGKGPQSVQTNAQGKFTIDVKGAKTITVTVVGYAPSTSNVTAATEYSIELEPTNQAMQQVVVVGYGTQKKANLTGAVATVDVDKTFGSRPVTDVARGLQGAVAGLTITTATGDLGTDPKIRLRGLQGSLNTGSGGAKPLVLVDNVEIPSLQMINPDDIESISVLKDAASASIYGTRGAFGVILITTKSGKKGAPTRITYSNNFAWSAPTTTPKLMGAADNSEATLAALQRTSSATSFKLLGSTIDQFAIGKMREWEKQYGGQDLGDEMLKGRDWDTIGGKLYFYRSFDPEKMYMKDWTLQQRHDINVSGGSEKTSYTLGLGYMNQDGILKTNPDQFKRYNLTLGMTTAVKDWLDVRGKLIYSNTLLETPFIFSGTQYGPLYYLYRWPANHPYGTVDGKPFRNAVTEVAQANMDNNKRAMSRISVGATLKPFKGFTLDADYTYTNINQHLKQVGGNTLAYNWWDYSTTVGLNYSAYQPVSYNKARYYSYWNEINTGKVFATYNKTINKDHVLKFIAGGDIELYRATDQSSERALLIDPAYGEPSLATGAMTADNSNSHWSTLGFFGRINYAYKNKLLLELNGRYDGSSKFPPSDLWGFFPSVSAGYVLTEEDYMDPLRDVLSFLKVRASYGSVGNQVVGNYRFLSLMSSSNSGWILPSGNTVTMSTPGALSPNLTWETINTLDFGVDARFIQNKLGVSFDWFRRNTLDMITAGVTLPSSFGTSSPVRNFGELQGTGWELSIDFNHTFHNGLHIGLTGTLSDALEKITKFSAVTKSLPGAIAAINTTYYEGMTLGEIWGYETDRLFTADDFSGVGTTKPGIPSQKKLESGSFVYGPGDIKYKDLDGDGEIFQGTNTVDNPGDKRIIGNSTPRYQYGFRIDADYKGFDLGVYVQGVAKRDLWASGPIVFPGFRAAESWFSHQTDYWKDANTPNAFYPRPVEYGATIDRWNFQPQTRYLLNLAYTRIKNITVGYTLPAAIVKKAGMQRARIYFTGENLITFDKLGDIPIDPEIDFSQTQLDNDRAGFGRVYPYRKTLAVGLQVTL
ncbi:SusC/RagA family TonB-linked outer membrane protein [Paraflavitalea pollutisoli]|uniref:SusC/RagA family TonB-linked outer membrane protein n=1 Tax=Paraflavitalea pollutisoli TaxID=3034143 RepID=UPI0023EBBDBF|nr:TonB-dependent receptor [Paraflavitalea sp. H1-2-19X]